jgi:phosphatidylglycerol:prolipoprotein diacylglycerol transferase
VPTYAYPVYEMLGELILLALLWLLRDRLRERPGFTFLLGAVGYALIRFGLTFYREEAIVLWGLQEAQLIALVTGLAALGAIVWRMSATKWRFAT